MFENAIFNFVLCALYVLWGYSSTTRGAENIPYIYFYSAERGAFFIERADGLDERLLTLYVLPEGHQIFGPGWSPSGGWFAWYSTIPGMSVSNSRGELVKEDGTHRVTVSENCSVISMNWSSSEDKLFVACYADLNNLSDLTYMIYDANQQALLLTLTASDFGLSGNISEISFAEWSPSGKYFIVSHANTGDLDETNYTMHVYSTGGTLVASRQFYTDNLNHSRPYWSTNDMVIYATSEDGDVLVENIQTNTHIEFDEMSTLLGWADWSLDDNYALIYEGSISDVALPGSFHPVWLLSVKDETLTLLSETARPISFKRTETRFSNTTSWAPSGELGIIVDAADILYFVVPTTGETYPIHHTTHSDSVLSPGFARWSNDGNYLTVVEYSENTGNGSIYIYDVNEAIALFSEVSRVIFDYLAYSPRSKYLAYGSPDCQGICVLDTASFQKKSLPFEDSRGHEAPAIQLLWHSEYNWLIAAGDPDGASRWLNIVNIDTNTNRALGWCTTAAACFGWINSVP